MNSCSCNCRFDVRKKQLAEMTENGPFYQKHFFQVREIKGQQHYQIFTDLGSGVPQFAGRFAGGNRSAPPTAQNASHSSL